MLLWIDGGHFFAGVVVGDRAAPIIRYMSKWTYEQISSYCQKKGWAHGVC